MKASLGQPKDFPLQLASSMLDGTSEAGGAGFGNLRVALNLDHGEQGVPARMGGWRKLGFGNEDLHDQLLGAQGWWALITEAAAVIGNTGETTIKIDDWEWILPDDVLTIGGRTVRVTSSINGNVIVLNSGQTFAVNAGDAVIKVSSGQREAITQLFPCTSAGGTRYLIACTKSRIYVSTGSALNFRLIADGLGGSYRPGDSPVGGHRWDIDKLGEYVVFTNNHDPVLAWRIGAPPVTEGVNKKLRWSAIEIYDLLGLGITSAGAVWSWNGYLFLGDVVVNGTRYSDRIYWCDFNRPLEWAPGGESVAGYVDLGGGQTVLRGARIGGTIRIYTDQAITVGEYIGGDAVFRFSDTYTGPRVMRHKWSFVNAGDTHYYLSGEGLVSLSKFDPSPNQTEWMQRLSGIILRGLQEKYAQQSIPSVHSFGPIDHARCDEIAAGFHEDRQEVWLCWPTSTADSGSIGQIRRPTLRISVRHGKASLVDHAFSAFTQWSPDHRMSVRDFMVTYCVCSAPGVVEPKEGVPLNTIAQSCTGIYGQGQYDGPDHIYNAADDGTGESSTDSLCAIVGDMTLDDLCPDCIGSNLFIGASLDDLCIKQFEQAYLRREMYSLTDDDGAAFPQTSPGAYTYQGYPTVIQGEMADFGYWNEKLVSAVGVAFDADPQSPPGQLRCAIATNNTPNCTNWYDADPLELSCLPTGASQSTHVDEGTRASELPAFAFHRAGVYVAFRLWVEGAPTVAGGDGPTSPVDCGFTLTSIQFTARPHRESWRKVQ